MTKQLACTLCGAGGHLAAQCNWNQAFDLVAAIRAAILSDWKPTTLSASGTKSKIIERIDAFLASQQGEQCEHSENIRSDGVCIECGEKVRRQHTEQAVDTLRCACPSGNGSLQWPCPEHSGGAQGEREAFEVAYQAENSGFMGPLKLERREDGKYKSQHVESAWRLWQARAALAQPSPERGQVVVTKKDGIIVAVTRQDAEGRVLSVIAEAQPSPAPELERPEVVTHSDDAAVDRFSASMKQKLEAARAKGRSGWDDPSSCDVAFLAERLIEHLGKGNAGTFEDVANFAMMLHQRGAHPQVLAEAAGAIERDYLRIIQAQEEKWSGRFEVLEDEAKTLRRERDAAQARVAGASTILEVVARFAPGVGLPAPLHRAALDAHDWMQGEAPVAQAGQVPEWIACEDRMPPVNENVLVTCEFTTNDWRIKVGGVDERGNWWVFGASWTPSHWQPLPAAPAQGDRDA